MGSAQEQPRQQPPLAAGEDQPPPPTYEAATSASSPPPQTQCREDGNAGTPRSSMSERDFEEMRQHLSETTAATDRHIPAKAADGAPSTQPLQAPPPRRPSSSSPRSSPAAAAPTPDTRPRRSACRSDRGYKPSEPMSVSSPPPTLDEKYAKMEDTAGCCFSTRGGCCFSDRGGCCFSDRGGCCFSDYEGCCFSNGARMAPNAGNRPCRT